VVAVTTDPGNLWDPEYGIYVKGPDAETDFPYFNANFWQDWERPAHVEFYDEAGQQGFNLDAGIRIYGGWTRGLPQKSMTIFARNQYGPGSIQYPLFPVRSYSEFESFVIRNSGNDWFGVDWESGTMFRDVLMTGLTRSMDLEYQEARPSVVYINGEYWGIHYIREKISEHYLSSLSGNDPDSLEILERNMEVIQGSQEHFASLINFLSSNDISRIENYEYVKQQMDVRNFIHYQLSEIFFDNRDWPGNNIKYWRAAGPQGKWRWILFDTDFGFGLWDVDNLFRNTIEFALEENGPGHPNPPWSTFMLRTLMENLEFRESFINTFADQINTSFQYDSVKTQIENLKAVIGEEMVNHAERWGGSYQQWTNRTMELREFARLRPSIVLSDIATTLEAGKRVSLNLDISEKRAGSIMINSVIMDEFPWQGTYFDGVPVTVTAVPATGYRFAGWTGTIIADSAKMKISLPLNTNLTARFEPDDQITGNPVIINEIFYRQVTQPDPGDWIELHNRSDQYRDISRWVLTDSNNEHAYLIKDGTLLDPFGYLVLCRDPHSFGGVYPEVLPVQGGYQFGFSRDGDMVRLYDSDGNLVDEVAYGITNPWPELVTENNLSIELKDAEWDNSSGISWEASKISMGTPGKQNSITLGMRNSETKVPPDILFNAFPNPFRLETQLVFFSGKDQRVTISIFDMNGRLVETVADDPVGRGYHEFNWSAGTLEPGFYIIRLKTPDNTFTQKIIKH
jgi:hypothetical protein